MDGMMVIHKQITVPHHEKQVLLIGKCYTVEKLITMLGKINYEFALRKGYVKPYGQDAEVIVPEELIW